VVCGSCREFEDQSVNERDRSPGGYPIDLSFYGDPEESSSGEEYSSGNDTLEESDISEPPAEEALDMFCKLTDC
jgi:hypothetical protein